MATGGSLISRSLCVNGFRIILYPFFLFLKIMLSHQQQSINGWAEGQRAAKAVNGGIRVERTWESLNDSSHFL